MITAELRNWVKCDHGQWYHYCGQVYGDKRGRWPDGSDIGISAVVSETHAEDDEEEYILATTLNSTYKLVIRPRQKKTDISVFKEILKKVPEKIDG